MANKDITTIRVTQITRDKIEDLGYDFRCKSQEDVILHLIDFYETKKAKKGAKSR